MAESPGTISEEAHGRRKKRRTVGAFPCLKCAKVFTRSDHLARHYLNHQPKQVYVCNYTIADKAGARHACGKTFVRRDLRERHYRRHLLERPDVSPQREVGQAKEELVNLPSAIPSPAGVKNEPLAGRASPGTIEDNAANGAMLDMAVITASTVSATPHTMSDKTEQKQTLAPRELVPAPLLGSFPGSFPGLRTTLLHDSHQYHVQNDQHIATNQAGQYIMPLQPPSSIFSQPPYMPLTNQQARVLQNPVHVSLDTQYLVSHQRATVSFPLKSVQVNSHNLTQTRPLTGQDSTTNGDHVSYGEGPGQGRSQNDILSWLFMESLQDLSHTPLSPMLSSIHSELLGNLQFVPATQPPAQQAAESSKERTFSAQNKPTWSSHTEHAMENLSMLNMGLHDLNYFLNGENPLDTVYSEFQERRIGNHSGAKTGVSPTVFTSSFSSPTNTTDSITSQSFIYPQTNESENILVKHILPYYLLEINVEKNKHLFLNKHLWVRIIESIPELTKKVLQNTFDEDYLHDIEQRMSFYLYGFWKSFHKRFSVLHKPSFSTATAEPLLLLSMLLIGCMYCASTPSETDRNVSCLEYKFCKLVAEPLRFKIFQHPGFKCPVEVWVLQSLNFLEWCEKNFLAREMHERGHVHHGTTVQLLRRSPLLGGNPSLKNKSDIVNHGKSNSAREDANCDEDTCVTENSLNKDQSLFQKWVKSESMKRITFMTFYLDSIDYIKFRHNPQISFFQLLLLDLPCEEDKLWNSDEVNGSFGKLVERQRKLKSIPASGLLSLKDLSKTFLDENFLSALKKLMKAQSSILSYSPFTKNILFAGMVSIMHQMQQTELQNDLHVFPLGPNRNRNTRWKEIIVKSMDSFTEGFHPAACELNPPSHFKVNESRCKLSMYHLALIIGILDINHYDIAIFSGSPRNMSVEVSSKDINIVKQKLSSIWKKDGSITSFTDLVNVRSVIHCYWFLWDLMFPPLGDEKDKNKPISFHDWDVDYDCLDITYAASVATLVLWCYIFSNCGLESTLFKSLETSFALEDQKSYEKLSNLVLEDGYMYLYRIRNEFSKKFNDVGLADDYCIHKIGTNKRQVPLFDAINKHCEVLPQISSKQNISGLCFLVGTKLYKSQWEIVRENAKLIINCGLRSVGKSNWQCNDVFENDIIN